MVEIWKAKADNTTQLPVIIPLVIYHGKDGWNLKPTLGEIIAGYEELPVEVQKLIPDYEYLLYDFSKLTAIHLLELEDKQTGMEYLETLVKYLLSVRSDLTKGHFNELIKKIETIDPEGSERIMSLAEIFREEGKEKGLLEGIEKGMERGIEIGLRKKEKEFIRNAINEGMDFALIAKLTGLPQQEVEKIAKELDN